VVFILFYYMVILKTLPVYFLKVQGNSFLLILSVSQGWGVLKLTYKSILLSSSLEDNFVQGYPLLFNTFLGFYKNYYFFLKLKGMGFKVIPHSKGVILKLGYSHKVLLLKTRDVCFFYLTRRSFQIKGRSGFYLKSLVYSLIQLRKTTAYKKKGIFLKGSVVKLKLTSKKSKF